MTVELRRLTAHGLRRAEEILSEFDTGANPDINGFLTDPELSEACGPEIEIRPFASRRDAADYFVEVLAPLESTTDVARDRGLWTWMSIAWMDLLCPVSDGTRKVKEHVRWILAVDDYLKYARHLLAGPYFIASAHAGNLDNAMAVLATKVESPGELVAQLTTRYEIVRSPGVLEAATRLYCEDDDRMSVKSGAGGKGPGSARRFADVFKQFELTWDLYAMSADEILELLPAEFDRFKPEGGTGAADDG